MHEDFSTEDIEEAARAGRLLSLEVEVGLRCDGVCDFCRADDADLTAGAVGVAGDGATEPGRPSISHRELTEVLHEARELGALRVAFLGTLGLTYPHLADLFTCARERGMGIDIEIGSDPIDRDLAAQIAASGARIVVSVHGLSDDAHDRVAGRAGSSVAVRRTIEELREEGVASSSILVHARICQANLHEMVPLWRWARTQAFAPVFENAAPTEASDPLAGVDPPTLYALFSEIREIDETEFDRRWDPQPPWPGRRDLRHKYSCLVSRSGTVFAPGLPTLPIGDVRPHGLAYVLRESEVLENLREHQHLLKGPCRSCEQVEGCAGSRAIAYAITGDYLASDPTCWRNVGRETEIPHLPADVSALLPQKAPMRFVDSIESVGDRAGECAVTLRDDMPMVGSGKLDDVAFLEIIAQAMAALQVWGAQGSDEAGLGGFLVGAEAVEVLGSARSGDRLRIHVRKDTRFGNYGIVSGTVFRGDSILARGQIKIWQESRDANT